MIRFHDVTVQVPVLGAGDKILLSGISATLEARRVSVIGSNGSGKSTFLRLINGLVAPSSGRVEVDGLDVARQAAAVRRRVGFTFSDALAQLIMVTPAEDVELSLRRSCPDRAARRRRARELLAAQGLDGVADSSIYALSGGERQLVALTSVLATEPAVLVCDEPTTLLDLRHRNRMIELLLGVAPQLIYATHDLDFAARADAALWIEHGRIAGAGDPGDVVAAYEEFAR